MARTKKGPATRHRRKALLKRAKGYCRGRNNRLRIARETVQRALRYARRDRRARKREMRSLWIQRINAGCRIHGLSYSRFIHGLDVSDIQLDRRVLADIAVTDSECFGALVELAKEASAATNREAA